MLLPMASTKIIVQGRLLLRCTTDLQLSMSFGGTNALGAGNKLLLQRARSDWAGVSLWSYFDALERLACFCCPVQLRVLDERKPKAT